MIHMYISQFMNYTATAERDIFYMQLCDWYSEIFENETVCN